MSTPPSRLFAEIAVTVTSTRSHCRAPNRGTWAVTKTIATFLVSPSAFVSNWPLRSNPMGSPHQLDHSTECQRSCCRIGIACPTQAGNQSPALKRVSFLPFHTANISEGERPILGEHLRFRRQRTANTVRSSKRTFSVQYFIMHPFMKTGGISTNPKTDRTGQPTAGPIHDLFHLAIAPGLLCESQDQSDPY